MIFTTNKYSTIRNSQSAIHTPQTTNTNKQTTTLLPSRLHRPRNDRRRGLVRRRVGPHHLADSLCRLCRGVLLRGDAAADHRVGDEAVSVVGDHAAWDGVGEDLCLQDPRETRAAQESGDGLGRGQAVELALGRLDRLERQAELCGDGSQHLGRGRALPGHGDEAAARLEQAEHLCGTRSGVGQQHEGKDADDEVHRLGGRRTHALRVVGCRAHPRRHACRRRILVQLLQHRRREVCRQHREPVVPGRLGPLSQRDGARPGAGRHVQHAHAVAQLLGVDGSRSKGRRPGPHEIHLGLPAVAHVEVVMWLCRVMCVMC
eukprot:m.42663 g.42663  ORF g.42663 m.42663 type:complete len:317 (+) comp12124_c0_seq1:326-1276(+)